MSSSVTIPQSSPNAVDDREAPHAVLPHDERRVGEPGLGAHRRRVRGHDLGDSHRARPPAGEDLDREVTIRDDPDRTVVRHDDEGAHVLLAHELRRLVRGRVGGRGDHVVAAELGEKHGQAPQRSCLARP